MGYKDEVCTECRFWEPADGRCLRRPGVWRRGDEQACFRFRLCALSRRERGLTPAECLRRKAEGNATFNLLIPGLEPWCAKRVEKDAAAGAAVMRAPARTLAEGLTELAELGKEGE